MLDANGFPVEEAPAEATPEVAPLATDGTPAPEEEVPAEPVVVLPGNCDGELEAQPQVEGVTHTQYKCKECGQLVHVGHEEFEANGLPPQHHKLEEEEKK
jgi:hypothetical protein